MSDTYEYKLGPIVEEAIRLYITNIVGCSQDFNTTLLVDYIINTYNQKYNLHIAGRDYFINQINIYKNNILSKCRLKDIKEKIMTLIMMYNYDFVTASVKGGRKTRKGRKSRKTRKSRKSRKHF